MPKNKIQNFMLLAISIGLGIVLISLPKFTSSHNKIIPENSNQLSNIEKAYEAIETTAPIAENRPAHRTHPYGGTLVWGTFNAPTIINPILTTHSISSSLMELIFNSLVRIDSQGQIVPGLAESWTISDDNLEYTFYLHKDVKFHDGVKLTSEDIKFTYEMISDPENNSHWRTNTELIDHWEIIDKYTLKIILKQPFPSLLAKLVREIVPKHIYQGNNLQTASFNYHPVGTGPFQFSYWDRQTNTIELLANPTYFEGRPYLDKILVKTYPDNKRLWIALMRGEVDFIQFINQEDYAVLKGDPSFNAHKIDWDMYLALAFNPKDPIYHDVEIRRAIAHAINKTKLMEISSINGTESTGPFHPDSPGFNPNVKPLEYDFRKARMMLMHRGWKDPVADAHGEEYEVRRKGGKKLELRLLIHSKRSIYTRMAKSIFLNLAMIGIDTKIITYDDEKELTPEYLQKHKPQAWLRFFQGVGLNPDEAVGSWHSSTKQFVKFWKYQNNKVDHLFEEAQITTDPYKQNTLFQKIHPIIYNDQPACFLFSPTMFHAVTAKFHNTEDYFNAFMPHYTLKDWYLMDSSLAQR